jgi:hypothetical protein
MLASRRIDRGKGGRAATTIRAHGDTRATGAGRISIGFPAPRPSVLSSPCPAENLQPKTSHHPG